MSGTEMETDNDFEWEGRTAHIEKLILRNGPFAAPGFEPSEDVKKFLVEKCKILIIGAGGLGCELLKNVALSGFRDITVIDLDTIDVSNLNRQFLFRKKDVNKPKAVVAAEFIQKRIPGVKITPIFGNIKDQSEDFYRQFNLILCGLDSIEARRWINYTIHELVDKDDDGNPDPSTIIPLIDGGTEGLKGQSRVIIPFVTACFECTLELFPPRTTYPLCTIAQTPRLPEHCIEYAATVQWVNERKDEKLDGDNPDHIKWLFENALARAKQHNIPGVTYRLTQGVVKNIIPAIASTNAIISASCAHEAFKMATSCAMYMNNYMMYMGGYEIYTHTFEYSKNESCSVCGQGNISMEVNKNLTLEQLIELLVANPNVQMKKPSITSSEKVLYMQSPPSLEEKSRPNLSKPLHQLVHQTDKLIISDPSLPFSVKLSLTLSD